jgi:hypothetical protein
LSGTGTCWRRIHSEQRDATTFLPTISVFNTPSTIARYDFTTPETHRFSILRSTKVNRLNPDAFESSQGVWYESKDGTKVPMFIVRQKSTESDGTAPAIQYGSSLPCLITFHMKRISNDRLCSAQVMVDLSSRWIHSLVQSSAPLDIYGRSVFK